MKQDQTKIIEQAGIEVIGDDEINHATINGELEIRINTRRKINRSMEEANGSKNFCGETFGLPLADLKRMQEENDHFIQKLLDLKRELSPYKDVVPKKSDLFEVGAILTDSYGWEQTNIDFYCIVKRAGKWLTILPMTKKSTDMNAQYMTREELPGEIDFAADPQRKKIQLSSDGKESGFSLRDYSMGGWCRLWDGEKETSTHYA